MKQRLQLYKLITREVTLHCIKLVFCTMLPRTEAQSRPT